MNTGKNSRLPGLIGVVLAAIITIGLTGLLHARLAMGDKPVDRVPLTVATTPYHLQDSYQRKVSYLGLVAAGRKARLGFEIAGTIAELPWREGSPVARGQLIARLDDASLQASYRATSADLAQARSELELAKLKARRQAELRETGAVSREAVDETRLRAKALESRVEAVAARLRSIEIQIDKATLRAPYAGVIADRFVQEGAVVNPGTPVVQLIETAGREANIGVAVAKARSLQPGSEYTLRLRGKTFASSLLTVRPDVDPVTRVTTAVFAIPEGIDAVDGEPITLIMEETVQGRGGWLPIAALLESSRGLWTVLRLEPSAEGMRTAREVVEVLETQGDMAYVRGSLGDGSQVVATGVHRTTPGTLVAVAGTD
ncbi:efflux RND transporter periplasmic adaptor subunit [Seongchinamella sediminis]|uniref:Efflux RND transporter periplasmic adaptor subunit n=1 Tax=Seongchinamella sediminis TaxID=2283635 RepID=A0A3L7DZ96_9GAMM|nr:efflux RND transporter periplasmic adaptor subunit [Seongchinamella sediminis]RLQ22917.1 efflux RND transporter periplasmic adaptor subunit [Seongchinamella sediminis]